MRLLKIVVGLPALLLLVLLGFAAFLASIFVLPMVVGILLALAFFLIPVGMLVGAIKVSSGEGAARTKLGKTAEALVGSAIVLAITFGGAFLLLQILASPGERDIFSFLLCMPLTWVVFFALLLIVGGIVEIVESIGH